MVHKFEMFTTFGDKEENRMHENVFMPEGYISSVKGQSRGHQLVIRQIWAKLNGVMI